MSTLHLSKAFIYDNDFCPHKRITFDFKFTPEWYQDCMVSNGDNSLLDNVLAEEFTKMFNMLKSAMKEHPSAEITIQNNSSVVSNFVPVVSADGGVQSCGMSFELKEDYKTIIHDESFIDELL